MARSTFDGIAIRGVAAAVPEARVVNAADHRYIPKEDREKVISLTGVEEYRRADAATCSSDLCQQAAENLMRDLQVAAENIDAIVFVSMTPDYRIPSTACLLQDRLGCTDATVAFDINMGCSGYVVGLYNACSLMAGGGLGTVLLLAGDTQTKLCYENDKNVEFILADAGTATLLQKSPDAAPITIELHTDGSRFKNLYIPAGGFRRMSDDASREVKLREDGGLRADDHLFMNGMEIFKFSSTDVVESLGHFMEEQSLTPDDVENLFLHQANRFMNAKIATKLKFDEEKVPYSITRYGNTGSASIPMTISHHYSNSGGVGSGRQLLCGFGVGLSWGMVDVVFDQVIVPPITDYTSTAAAPAKRKAVGPAVMLFPGQGSQFVGMGQEIYSEYPAVRDLFDAASQQLNIDFRSLCFEGPADDLVATQNAQPAVTLVNIACFEVLSAVGYEPIATGGHSLGEYAALYAAGALSFQDAMMLVSERGRLMQDCAEKNPGGMIAVLGLSPESVIALLSASEFADAVEVANINSPSEIIMTGSRNELEAFGKQAVDAGAANTVMLRVSGPWHSRHMQQAADEMARLLADTDVRAPKVPVTCNVTGSLYDTADDIRNRLVQQVTSPVKWIECERCLLELAAGQAFVEVGPGNTLARLLKSLDTAADARPFDIVLKS